MKSVRRIICLLLAVFLVIGMAAALAAEGGSGDYPAGVQAEAPIPDIQAAVEDKDEVVYARLSGDGSAQSIYVVNHFSLSGIGWITDYGDYTSVLNLTDLQPIKLENGTVSVPTSNESFYYQGNLAGNDLPWVYNIEYRLNGASVSPESLGGSSGSLEIRLTSSQNNAVDAIFFNNYMQQITITLNNDDCSNIRADGATVANAGKNRMLVFTVLPGQNADITVSADVVDFEMGGIDINAMPFSMSFDIPDTDGMLDEFSLLTDAIAALNDGVGLLKDGAVLMASGSAELREGSSEFLDGLSQLSLNSNQLTGASAQIMGALSLIADSLNSTEFSPDMLAELSRLPGLIAQLADGLNQVVDGMKEQKDAYSQAYSALDKAIAGIPGNMITGEQLQSLYAKADEDERALLDQLIEGNTAASAVMGAYEQTKQVFASVTTTLDSLSRSNIPVMLDIMSAQISGALSDVDIMAQLGQLIDGMSELSRNYAGFHSGLSAFMQGVSALNDGYSALDGGIGELSGGIAETSGGIAELHDGTVLLAAETSDIPNLIKHEIENLISEFSSAEFEAKSFTSGRNVNISFVQFVFKTEGIQKPAAENSAPIDAEQPSFWDRVAQLFGRGGAL